MKRKGSELNEPQNTSQFPPQRIVRLLSTLKSALSLVEARSLSLEYLEQLTGRPAGTIGSWCDGARMQQLEFLFALLERLPPQLRHQVVDTSCRDLPSLQHSKLLHDATAVRQLEKLLEQRNGLTVIQGEPGHMRGFLLAALGNSFQQLNQGSASVSGVDLEKNLSWAPVPGVVYTQENSSLPQHLDAAWRKIKNAEAGSLILIGTMGRGTLQLHSGLARLAARCHVIMVDPQGLKPQERSGHFPKPLNFVTVAPAREQPEWIRASIFQAT